MGKFKVNTPVGNAPAGLVCPQPLPQMTEAWGVGGFRAYWGILSGVHIGGFVLYIGGFIHHTGGFGFSSG